MPSIESVSTKLVREDFELFVASFTRDISSRYPFSSELTARAIIDAHNMDYDEHGHFSKRKKIWKGVGSDGTSLAFTVVTEKRGGSIKFGPTIVLSDYRNIGVGSTLREKVEGNYSELGYRKAYSTTNLRNLAGIYYLTKIGYKIELHLRDHYELGKDELVLSKFISRQGENGPPLDGKLVPTAEDVVTSSLESSVDKRLYLDLRFDFDEIDKEFFDRTRAALEVQTESSESDFVQKKKHLFFSTNQKALALAVPKRGGCVKLLPFITSATRDDNAEVLASVWGALGSTTHKLYTLVPARRWAKVENMKSLGFVVEGIIAEPYKPRVDVVMMSTWRKS
jgi:hypothetical protein